MGSVSYPTTRARQVSKRVELLAASAMGVQAPPPREHSLAMILIKELKKALTSQEGISAAKPNSNPTKKESGYKRSPVRVGLGPGTNKSICLTPMRTTRQQDAEEQQGRQLTLQITLCDVLTKSSIPSII